MIHLNKLNNPSCILLFRKKKVFFKNMMTKINSM